MNWTQFFEPTLFPSINEGVYVYLILCHLDQATSYFFMDALFAVTFNLGLVLVGLAAATFVSPALLRPLEWAFVVLFAVDLVEVDFDCVMRVFLPGLSSSCKA